MIAKKKENVIPEEQLQAALVPDGEQPYPVPENWCWTRMQNIAHWGSGGTPSRKIPEYYDGNIPWIKTGELNDGYIFETEEHITEEALSNSSAKLFPVNTVVIAMYGATIGKAGILGIEATTNQACACGIAYPITNFKYLFYYVRSQKDAFINQGKGGAQPNISQEIIKSHLFPLPPLSEQQRIVERIESLFAKLDEAKQKVQDTLDNFETRKAVVLHKAFAGELTARWRKKHGVGMESWKEQLFKDTVTTIKDKFNPTIEKTSLKYIGLEHIEKNAGITGFGTAKDIKSLKTVFRSGDILYGKLRPYLNKHDVAEFNGICSTDILVYRVPNLQTAKYINYFMDTETFISFAVSNSKGINLPRISAKEIGGISVKIPSVQEQTEIVHILDDFFAKEQQAREAVEGVPEQIDLIKKSILGRAFRGELGTNDPGEESAVGLIKQTFLETIALGSDPKMEKGTGTRTEVMLMPKTIMEALSDGVRLTPEKLKAETGLQIDDFYEQLKAVIDKGEIIETRMDGDSYLEAANADRQTENQEL